MTFGPIPACFCGSPPTHECYGQGFGGSIDCGRGCCAGHMTCDWHGATVFPAKCPECEAIEPEHAGHAGYCSQAEEDGA